MASTLSTARLLSLLPLFLASASARPGRCKPSVSSTLSSVEVPVSTLLASSDVVSISISSDVISSTSSAEAIPSSTSLEVIPSSTLPDVSSTIPEPELSTTSLPVSSVEASTTTEAPSSSETPGSSSIPSSTTPPTSTTPEGPPMTTITSCPPTPTVAGPAQCYTSLPSSCVKLSSMPAVFNSRLMSNSLRSCQMMLTTYGNAPNPTASACFPTSTATNPPDLAVATETLASVYSCLLTANVLCSYNADCQTKTYPVGQVPEPTPSIGVDMLYDGGFESGTYGNWTPMAGGANMPTELSTQNPHTGNWAFHAKYANFNGISRALTRNILGIEPGRQYQLKAWILHDNPTGASTSFTLGAYPGAFTTPASETALGTLLANTWSLRVLTFTATTSWLQLQLVAAGLVSGVTSSPGGVDNIWIDDVTLTRLD